MTAPLLTTAEPCQVHKDHKPFSHVNHRHHVWPLGMGGPDTEDNIVVVCPTGHMNIHHLIDEYRRRGTLTYTVTRRYTRGERELAKLGYDRFLAGEM